MFTKKTINSNDLSEMVEGFKLKGDIVLIKPNWVGAYPGGYTDAKVIDLLLTSLKGKKVIFLESYTFWRTDKMKSGQGDYFSSKEATLESGKHHWDFFNRMDQWFLGDTGIGDVLKKHDAQYLNITNEIWQGKIADPQKIASLIESRFLPVTIKDLYSAVPQFLLDLEGVPLISLAKAKIDSAYGGSFSIKNLFGLIPDPTRYEKYHGGDSEKLLSSSIIDVNKIYQSLFEVKYVVESVFEYSRMDWTTETSHRIEGNGIIIAGDDGYKVDSEAQKTYHAQLAGPLKNLLQEYRKVFI